MDSFFYDSDLAIDIMESAGYKMSSCKLIYNSRFLANTVIYQKELMRCLKEET